MITIEKIQELTEKYHGEVAGIRKELHRFPELALQEYRTSEYIQTYLQKLGIPFTSGYAITGILAVIEGNKPDIKTLALRADMDALPIKELTGLDYQSEHPGIMHACGHDAHMAMLLGAARILKEVSAELEGRVLLIFQPSEEKLPGGALRMIEEGALSQFPPDIVIAQHVMPELPSGTAGFCPGKYMASTDELYISIKGTGGHAAMPDQITDSVLIAAQLLVSLQQLISRMAPPGIPSVLSFGRIEADGACNIIPSEVKLFGTFRTLDENWRYQAHEKIKKLCEGVVTAMGAACELEIQPGYPAVDNDSALTAAAMDLAAQYLGHGQAKAIQSQMTAEDFAYFGRLAPSLLFRLGIAGKEGLHSKPLHSPFFSIDEEALKTGVGLLSWFALSLLGKD
ncbi:MAG: amidohydrolase [Bacteroidales bacterium]|nr:amidohydrolase [Bacteroidales bacterium]